VPYKHLWYSCFNVLRLNDVILTTEGRKNRIHLSQKPVKPYVVRRKALDVRREVHGHTGFVDYGFDSSGEQQGPS
jgi:hypothetical protein